MISQQESLRCSLRVLVCVPDARSFTIYPYFGSVWWIAKFDGFHCDISECDSKTKATICVAVKLGAFLRADLPNNGRLHLIWHPLLVFKPWNLTSANAKILLGNSHHLMTFDASLLGHHYNNSTLAGFRHNSGLILLLMGFSANQKKIQ